MVRIRKIKNCKLQIFGHFQDPANVRIAANPSNFSVMSLEFSTNIRIHYE